MNPNLGLIPPIFQGFCLDPTSCNRECVADTNFSFGFSVALGPVTYMKLTHSNLGCCYSFCSSDSLSHIQPTGSVLLRQKLFHGVSVAGCRSGISVHVMQYSVPFCLWGLVKACGGQHDWQTLCDDVTCSRVSYQTHGTLVMRWHFCDKKYVDRPELLFFFSQYYLYATCFAQKSDNHWFKGHILSSVVQQVHTSRIKTALPPATTFLNVYIQHFTTTRGCG